MDPAYYLDEIVKPTIEEYDADSTSVRRAFIACVVTFHSVDYLGGSRQKFGQACPEFATIDRIAHAFKHVETGHPNNALTPPLTASEVITRPPGFLDVSFTFDLSRFDDPTGGVTLRPDTRVDLGQVLRRAYEFLEAKARDITGNDVSCAGSRSSTTPPS